MGTECAQRDWGLKDVVQSGLTRIWHLLRLLVTPPELLQVIRAGNRAEAMLCGIREKGSRPMYL
jgi:hypothetical protein